MSNAAVTQDDYETNPNSKARSPFPINSSIDLEVQRHLFPQQQMVHQYSTAPLSHKTGPPTNFSQRTFLGSIFPPRRLSKPSQKSIRHTYAQMCVDKEYRYECGCVETDHMICMRNLDGPRFSRNCPQYRGVEKIAAEGSCQRHTMHPKPPAPPREDGEGEGSKKKRTCSACCPMM